MYKKIIIVFFHLCAAVFVSAQDSARHKLSEIFQQEYDFFSRKAITQPLFPVQQYALVEGSYKNNKGAFMARQDAPEMNEISFFTQGTRKVKQFLVSGAFSFQRTLNDSVAYTLKTNDEVDPLFFYSGGKGNWELSRYKLKGIISTPLFHKKMNFAIGAAYLAGNSWRISDPRVEDFLLGIETEASVHYNINLKHTLGGSFGFNTFTTENSIEYRNKALEKNIQQFPDMVTAINYGYGFFEYWTSGQQMYSYKKGHSANGIYQGKFNLGTLTLTGGYHTNHSFFEKKPTQTSTSKLLYGKFNEEIYTSDLIWKSRPSQRQTWSLIAGYKNHYGRDFNVKFGDNNFIYYNTQLSVRPVYEHLKNNQLKYEIALNGNLSRLYRADGTLGLKSDYKNAILGGAFAYYFSGNKVNNFLKISAGLDFQMNISAKCTLSQDQETVLVNGQVYYDYYFNNAKSTKLSLSALYNFSIKKLPLFIKSTYQIQNAKLPEITLPATTFPGTERHFGSFSLGFTL